MSAQASPAPAESLIMSALNVLFDSEQIIELRAFPKGRKRTDAGYFDGAHRDDLARLAAGLNSRGAAVYVTLNAVDPQLLGRYANRVEQYANATTTDANIERRRWLLIDLDPVRPKDTAATEDQLAATRESMLTAAKWLDAKGWPAPTMAESGNGVHLLYPIDLPNDEATTQTIKAALVAVADEIDNAAVKVDRVVFNAARITKLYGTVATKGDHLPAAPHRLSHIVNAPGRDVLVTLDQLVSLAPPQPTEQRHAGDPPPRNPQGNKRFDIDDFLARLGIGFTESAHNGRDRFLLAHCPFDPNHGKGEAAIFRAASGKLGFKCQHDSCSERHWQDVRALVDGPRVTRDRASTSTANDGDSDDSATEDAVALAFTSCHGKRLRWVQEWSRWLRWDGTRWAPDRTVEVMDFARQLCRTLAGADEKRAKVMRQAPFVAAVERLARSDRRHASVPEQFDSGDFLLNTPAGIVDLTTGAISPHDPARFLTKITRAAPGSECPTWRQFLLRITGGDSDLQTFLQRIAGYACMDSSSFASTSFEAKRYDCQRVSGL